MSTKEMIQLDLIEKICPRCLEGTSKVGVLHPDDGLCVKCEREWVALTSGEEL